MTRLEKLSDLNELAKFLEKLVNDCDLCPCMKEGICDASYAPSKCVKSFKEYLSMDVKRR